MGVRGGAVEAVGVRPRQTTVQHYTISCIFDRYDIFLIGELVLEINY